MTKQMKISAILEAMMKSYDGAEGDFADAESYYTTDACDEEIDADFDEWCN